MYTPPKYKNEDKEDILSFVREHSFGILIAHDEQRPIATHIPIEVRQVDGKEFLIGHISKANQQWKTFSSGQKFLAIFSAPHTYVSASWYKEETVSTWNYIAVHAYGNIRILEKEELYQSLDELMSRYEQGSEKPLHLKDIDPKKVQQLMRGIVGFKMEVTDWQANYKLSQNRSEEDYDNIIQQLEKSDDSNVKKIADEMKERKQ